LGTHLVSYSVGAGYIVTGAAAFSVKIKNGWH